MRERIYIQLLLSAVSVCQVSSLQCYTCSGKKSQCATSSDPGQETECPSIFSLIRPKVMLTLDAKWKETAGNRTDTNIKNVLMTTYSEMYLQVPTLAIMKVMDDIPELPVKDDLISLNAKVWKSVRKDCVDLGCKYSKAMETDMTKIDELFDHRYSVKWNNNTLQSTLTSLFTSIEDLLPNEASTNSSLNISMDTSKEDLKTELDNILASLNSDCKADPCTYTVNTTAAITDTLEANWTSLTETKTDEAVTTVLRNAFTNFEPLIAIPALNSSGIDVNTTKDELTAMVDEYWNSLNAECTGSDCTGDSTIKAEAVTTMGNNWANDSVETMTGLLTTARDTINTKFLAHFRTKADGLVGTEDAAGTKTVTAATTFSEIQTTVEEVLTALGEKCLNSNCSYTALLKSTVNNKLESGWGSVAPTTTKIQAVFDTLVEKIKTDFQAHFDVLKTEAVNEQRGNISGNSSKEDFNTTITNILTKISEECKDGGCKFSEPLKTLVGQRWADKFITLSLNKLDVQQILGLSYLEIEFKFGEDSPIKTLASNITSRTMFSDLVMISDDALKQAIGDGPDNGCTYQEKMDEYKFFRDCMYSKKSKLELSHIPGVKVDMEKTKNNVGAKICTEPLCNQARLFTCYVCDGPNNICKNGELGTISACLSDQHYCIKELSGDDTNRELVARKCGNEFDREATCGSSGDNIGIAASGLVRCCNNREENNCNSAQTIGQNVMIIQILALVFRGISSQ